MYEVSSFEDPKLRPVIGRSYRKGFDPNWWRIRSDDLVQNILQIAGSRKSMVTHSTKA